MERETIFALATAQGRAGVGIIRISGPQAFTVARQMSGALPPPKRASLRTFKDLCGEIIDQGLLVLFPGPGSFSGEDIAEIHCHGSPAVYQKFLSSLSDLDGLRIAEAGEFTRRAFESGNLDLTQVEGLGSLIEAETDAQRRLSMAVYSGELSEQLGVIREALLRAAAFCEASIDFADEEVPEDTRGPTLEAIDGATIGIELQISGFAGAKRIQDGVEVAIVGAPNAGKSTLLNAIAGEDVAIVTDVAGTTRDVIEIRTQLDGTLVRFLDMAGLRESTDVIEAEGIERARRRARAAELRIFLSDDGNFEGLELHQPGDIKVYSKGDLTGREGAISAKAGTGVKELLTRVSAQVSGRITGAGLMASERQVVLLRAALDETLSARDVLKKSGPEEVCAAHIRSAILKLEQVIGRIDVEDVLGQIFSSFCIGK